MFNLPSPLKRELIDSSFVDCYIEKSLRHKNVDSFIFRSATDKLRENLTVRNTRTISSTFGHLRLDEAFGTKINIVKISLKSAIFPIFH